MKDAKFLKLLISPFSEEITLGYFKSHLPKINLIKFAEIYNSLLKKSKLLYKQNKSIQELDSVDLKKLDELDLLLNIAFLSHQVEAENVCVEE